MRVEDAGNGNVRLLARMFERRRDLRSSSNSLTSRAGWTHRSAARRQHTGGLRRKPSTIHAHVFGIDAGQLFARAHDRLRRKHACGGDDAVHGAIACAVCSSHFSRLLLISARNVRTRRRCGRQDHFVHEVVQREHQLLRRRHHAPAAPRLGEAVRSRSKSRRARIKARSRSPRRRSPDRRARRFPKTAFYALCSASSDPSGIFSSNGTVQLSASAVTCATIASNSKNKTVTFSVSLFLDDTADATAFPGDPAYTAANLSVTANAP